MISVADCQEFIPNGRLALVNHPQEAVLHVKHHHREFFGSEGEPAYGLRKHFLEPHDDDSSFEIPEEFWSLSSESNGKITELYYRNSTVVWSQGDQVIKTFTFETKVKEALWCTFHQSTLNPIFSRRFPVFSTINTPIGKPGGTLSSNADDKTHKMSETQKEKKRCKEGEEELKEPFRALCIQVGNSIKMYSETGSDYTASLPFSIQKCWSSKYGLLCMRKSSGVSKTHPLYFALLHPLDDLTRILIKKNNTYEQIGNENKKIIFTASEPSIAVIFNSELSQHSIWRIRRATPSENRFSDLGGMERANNTMTNMSHHGLPTFNSGESTPMSGLTLLSGGSMSRSPSGLLSQSATPMNSHGNSPMTTTSGSARNSTSQPLNSQSQSQCQQQSVQQQQPSPFATLATICRSPSTGTFPNLSRHLFNSSNNSSYATSPRHCGGGGADGLGGADERGGDERGGGGERGNNRCGIESLPPEVSLTLEHTWTDSNTLEEASTVFLSSDTIGRTYINFLHADLLLLSVIRYEESNDGRQLIFSSLRSLSALDAVFLPDLHLTLTLESSCLTLYSGTTKVCKVVLSTQMTQMAHIANEISSLYLDSKPSTPNRRIVTSSRPPSASLDSSDKLQESLLKFSPIEEYPTNRDSNTSINNKTTTTTNTNTIPNSTRYSKCSRILRLQDPLGSSVTLKYINGSYVRVTLPTLATSPLVLKALETIKISLSRVAALATQSHWYALRNAPGHTHLSPSKEWELFSKCLLSLMGYDVDKICVGHVNDTSLLSPSSSKKMRTEDEGSDADWQSLLSSSHHREIGTTISTLLGLEVLTPVSLVERKSDESASDISISSIIDTNAPLFSSIPSILWSLHLLYENCKLDKLSWENLHLLSELLVRLSADLNMPLYVDHYWRDFTEVPIGSQASTGQMNSISLSKLVAPSQMTAVPPSITRHLLQILSHDTQKLTPFPIMPKIAKRTRELIILYVVYSTDSDVNSVNLDSFLKVVNIPGNREEVSSEPLRFSSSTPVSVRLVDLLIQLYFTLETIESIPFGYSLPLRSALWEAAKNPPNSWPNAAYTLIGRHDLVSAKLVSTFNSEKVIDGTEEVENEITRFRWPHDRRLTEVRRLLQSSRPVTVSVIQRPDMSDHEFVEEQEKTLHSLCIRTMALPVGRGALSLNTSTPLMTEPFPIPKLCLSGRAPPRGATVEMDRIDVSPNEERWPTFHNGVAAGLCISYSSEIDSSWITFNKPVVSLNLASSLGEHAGFLLALGLNGHLPKLGKLESFDYLEKGNELISIGLLLGLSASKRGTMDILATKKVSTQLEALLPPTATELPLSHSTQVAGLIGLGLLYERTGHRHMAEVCLRELAKPPGPELENCTDRESYSLAAGMALGLITLGQGNEQLLQGPLTDLNIPDALYHHMIGGPKSTLHTRNTFRSPSYQIQEGDSINIDVTSPGATLALGMMFFNTGNKGIADWMTAPKTQFLLEFVRPDFLMLRTLSKGLILWDQILPTLDWIESHVPDSILPYSLVRPTESAPPGVDYETINQAYCNIIGGAGLVLALRFAGSSNAQAFDVLHTLTLKLIAISKRSVAELAGKATIEQTLIILVLSLSIVMSGSGDLEIIRIIRYLRSRTGNANSTVTYGSHMCIHMSLGLLFLGGGTQSLCTTPEAVAAMIIAFFPKFPTHSNDNRYHLQALRHFYVLASEPRLLVPRDAETSKLSYCHFSVKLKDTPYYSSVTLKYKAPALLPELQFLSSVEVSDDRYHSIVFEASNMKTLKYLLRNRRGNLAVKRRTGCVSYEDDPQGFRSLTAQCLSRDSGFQWSAGNNLLENFKNVDIVNHYNRIFLNSQALDSPMGNIMGAILYECTCHEKLDFLPVWISIFYTLESFLKDGLCRFGASQLSLFLEFFENTCGSNLLCSELSASVKQTLFQTLDSWKTVIKEPLKNYLRGTFTKSPYDQKLTAYLVINNLAPVGQSSEEPQKISLNPLHWINSMSGSTAFRLYDSIQ